MIVGSLGLLYLDAPPRNSLFAATRALWAPAGRGRGQKLVEEIIFFLRITQNTQQLKSLNCDF